MKHFVKIYVFLLSFKNTLTKHTRQRKHMRYAIMPSKKNTRSLYARSFTEMKTQSIYYSNSTETNGFNIIHMLSAFTMDSTNFHFTCIVPIKIS